ncbi:hypothetical protein [Candidatus Weimeria sp. HCP3S3_B5]|uniref:hypothetical protein n=1 Tax=Candidatus Weimeria sp. HCP3S3_B5 TaxID=3438871 RepID=UPI002A98A161|nr:hypothetical protein [Lachnospiraceae bacterium]MDY6351903.1 hypothetical protein [Lachnospiraceae bacterium]
MAKDEATVKEGQESSTEAEIREFRSHLGIGDHDDETPLIGKMEQALDRFAEVDSKDILDALNSLSDEDDR